MITCIIKNDGEDGVVQLTYENLWRELKDIPGSDIIVSDSWFDYLPKIKNKFVCFVEADCLVSEGYFIKQLAGILADKSRRTSMFTACVAVDRWNNCFYGYQINYEYTQNVIPNKSKKSNNPYQIEIGYVPGALIRLSMLKKALIDLKINDTWKNDLVFLSSQLSLAFWRQGANRSIKNIQNGNPVYINPDVTYVSTETYINDIGKFELDTFDLQQKFVTESI